ncbi:MAG TPA: DUF3575 domain-containing protein [Saprospiraceae bacterium]|nr:DUF3575 domain-containing protein [Saprospiraceae bacterium]
MRQFLILIILLYLTGLISAQDTLYKTDGAIQIVKLLEVNPTQIKYKLIQNPDSLIHVLSKENVIRIVSNNGLITIISETPTREKLPNHLKTKKSDVNIIDSLFTAQTPKPVIKNKVDLRKTDFGRNFISLNVSDLYFSSFTINYDYTFKSGKSVLKFPISIALRENTDGLNNNNPDKKFTIGLDYYYFPTGQGESKYFLGPALEYGKYNVRETIIASSDFQINSRTFYSIIFQNGVLFQPSKHFNLSFNLGIGYAKVNIQNSFYQFFSSEYTLIRFGINMGYKF